VVVDRKGCEAEPLGGLGVPREVPEGRGPLAEAYQGKMYAVIHAMFAAPESSHPPRRRLFLLS
jgi:hypothetical protein